MPFVFPPSLPTLLPLYTITISTNCVVFQLSLKHKQESVTFTFSHFENVTPFDVCVGVYVEDTFAASSRSKLALKLGTTTRDRQVFKPQVYFHCIFFICSRFLFFLGVFKSFLLLSSARRLLRKENKYKEMRLYRIRFTDIVYFFCLPAFNYTILDVKRITSCSYYCFLTAGNRGKIEGVKEIRELQIYWWVRVGGGEQGMEL